MKLVIFRPTHREPPPAGGTLVSQWQVGRRTVRLVQDVHVVTGSVGVMRCEWMPDMPRKLSEREWREYRAGRDQHHQRVANIVGGAVAVVE